MTRLVIISDTHTQHRQLVMPKGDILIHCGDWTYTGGMSELVRLNDWFGDLLHMGYKAIVTVPGNHDLTAESNPKLVRSLLTNATVLINESAEVGGLRMWGSPVTPEFCDWAFMLPDKERELIFMNIPKELDVLITHGPPYGIQDSPFGQEGRHVGCESLLEHVKRTEPRIHCFGHIHGSYGMVHAEGIETLFINASVVNEKYKVVNPIVEIDYEDEEV